MRSRNGFTLIELILGLLIFSIIAGTVYSVFAGGVRLSRISEQRVSSYREAGWAFSLLTRELENMARFDVSGMKDAEPVMTGEKDEISFILPAGKGLQHVKYYLLSPASGKIHQVIVGKRTKGNTDINLTDKSSARKYFLVREERNFLDVLSGRNDPVKPEIIAGNIKENSLKFEYGYSEGEMGESIKYKDSWSQGDIPSKIRISMEMIDDYDEQSVLLTRDVIVPHGVMGKTEN